MAQRFRRGWDYDVEKQVRVTVNQSGQQGHAAQIDGLGASRRVRLHPSRRANFLDLAVLNQHGRWREDISGPRIEEPACFDQSDRSYRLGGDLNT